MAYIKRAALSHTQIISRLRNQTLKIPPLSPIFAHWPCPSPNPHLVSLIPVISSSISDLGVTRPSLLSRQKDNIPLLVSLWYPRAPLLKLQTLARYSAWLICWDDEVDANEGDLSGNYVEAEAWRNETLDVVRASLGLGSPDAREMLLRATDPLHTLMILVGQDLQKAYSVQQRQHFLNATSLFVRSCATEQTLRLSKTIPDYESYMSMRLNTVGGDMLCSLIEYSQSSPSSASASPLSLPTTRSALDKQVSILLSLLNDLLSLKKELRTDCVINAVTSLMTEDNTLESVVADILGMMKEAVAVFDDTAREFEEGMYSQSERDAARRYIDGCRSIVTGTLEFTLKSPRYKLATLLGPDGSLSIAL